jgi:hypothetical protein
MDAFNLYQSGINQESSDPAGALKTLLQAQQDSRAAILHGGGNSLVLHNDWVISHAVTTARMDASKTPGNNQSTTKPNTVAGNPVKTVGYHAQTRPNTTTAHPVMRVSMN